MQNFIIPQFIDIEPKILGPLTVRQFIIMLACGLLLVAEWKTCDFTLFAFLGVITFGVFGAVAFLRINGRPFHYFVLNFIQTFKKPKARVWWKEMVPERRDKVKIKQEIYIPPPKRLAPRKLSELTLIIDTGGAYREEEENGF